ncbi:MAG: biopolymer transporter ExbD [Verrucomicrobiota bacterium]
MRRFSQRNSLVTLSDINITPLLDLAFVLLIIFVITTPLLEKGMDLKLPTSSSARSDKIDPRDVRTVEINAQGIYMLNKKPMKLDALVNQLALDYKFNPNLVIYIRADENSRMKDFVALTDACTRNGISRYSIRTQPIER